MTPRRSSSTSSTASTAARQRRAAPGTGLGLAIVQSLVDLHGGHVDARDRRPARARRSPSAARRTRRRAPVARPREALRGRRVLVIDDEPEIAQLIAERLEPFGVEAAVATTAPRRCERLRTEPFDAMTLDILMPGMSGFEVLRQLRADPELRGLPVVVVSVFSGHEALAGEWVVAKPIDADELVDALGAARARRPGARARRRAQPRRAQQLEPRARRARRSSTSGRRAPARPRGCASDAALRGRARRCRAARPRGRARGAATCAAAGCGAACSCSLRPATTAPGLARLDAEPVRSTRPGRRRWRSCELLSADVGCGVVWRTDLVARL